MNKLIQTNSNYNADSVQTLEGLTPFRKSPGMYIGATNEYGLHHVVKEIVNNSVDEFLNADCDIVTIILLADGGICVTDNGRGFPHGMLDDKFSILGGCFGKEHTGGKFNNRGESGYNTSGGMHGIGCKCAAALGTKTIAISYRDGIKELVEFSQGKMLRQITNDKCDKKLHGTSVTWYPDAEIFSTITFNREKIENELCREYSFLNSGLRFVIKDERVNYQAEYYSEHGIIDYLNYLNKEHNFLLKPFYLTANEDEFSVELGIAYNDQFTNTTKLYTNSIPQTRGTHLTGFKTAWTSSINKFARENKLIKDKEPNLTGDNLAEGQILIINFKMVDPVFEGQVKENLTSLEGRTYVQKLITSSIDTLFKECKSEIKTIINKAIGARRASEAAKKARDAIRQPKSKGLKAKVELSDKLAECNGKDRDKCELWLLEGDSAIGSAKQARDPVTQSVMALRGKVLNTEKVEVDKMLGNKELATIISVLGTGYGDNFNVDKCRYGKIIFLTDADVDGSHIDLLLLTFFYRYMRGLIENGKIYLTVPPLFRARKGNDYVYLKDEAELAEYRLSHTNFDLTKFKGIGEMSADQLWETTMNPEVRMLKRMTIEDAEEANRIITELMGKEVKYRKEFLSEFGDTVEIDV